jgi:hypothetical protein
MVEPAAGIGVAPSSLLPKHTTQTTAEMAEARATTAVLMGIACTIRSIEESLEGLDF